MKPLRSTITSAAAPWCFAFRSFFSSVWTQHWENCPDRASRGNCRTMRLPGCNTVRARSRRNWDIPTNCGPTGCWSLTCASTASPPGIRRCVRLSRSKLHKILRQGELRPHKIRYYVEKRDPDFEIKMASVLHVYKEVEIVNEYLRGEAGRQLGMVTISYDEKPGIQALAVTTPDRPPVVGTHPSHLRDYEYVRLGTVSLLAGLDLHTGRVTETVSDTHNSADFIAFLQKLDGAYPEHHQIRLVLDNHSAHISKETRGYLQTMPQRFVFVFTPKHGSWLNLIENQFSKMTRTMLRGIRVASKQELIDRIHQYFEEINAAPVVFRWKYKMDEIIIV